MAKRDLSRAAAVAQKKTKRFSAVGVTMRTTELRQRLDPETVAINLPGLDPLGRHGLRKPLTDRSTELFQYPIR